MSLSHLAGRFIVFDGPDGSGKSTQFKRFAQHCRDAGLKVCEVREPGGTAIGEQIRTILLNPANAEMSLRCEMMLYMASRAQLMEQIVQPALERGELVLADRFISSTLAYQGTAGGLSEDEILAVGNVAIGERWPDLTIVFDVDEQTASRRLMGESKRSSSRADSFVGGAGLFADRMERKGAEFQRRVRQGFLDQVRANPQKYLLIDASADADSVFGQLVNAVAKSFTAETQRAQRSD